MIYNPHNPHDQHKLREALLHAKVGTKLPTGQRVVEIFGGGGEGMRAARDLAITLDKERPAIAKVMHSTKQTPDGRWLTVVSELSDLKGAKP